MFLDAHNSGGNKCLSVPEASWHWAHNNKQMHPSRPNDRNQRRSSALGGLDFEEPAQLLAIGASHRFLRWCGNGTAAPIQTGTSDDAHETLSSEESAHLLQHRHSWWWLQHLLGSSLVPASRSTYIPAAGPLWMPGGNCPHGRAEGIDLLTLLALPMMTVKSWSWKKVPVRLSIQQSFPMPGAASCNSEPSCSWGGSSHKLQLLIMLRRWVTALCERRKLFTN